MTDHACHCRFCAGDINSLNLKIQALEEQLAQERKRREQMLDLQSRNATLEKALKGTVYELKVITGYTEFGGMPNRCMTDLRSAELSRIAQKLSLAEEALAQAGESSTGREDTGEAGK